jgi:branched-chain amino acid transport system substrate-binding protein
LAVAAAVAVVAVGIVAANAAPVRKSEQTLTIGHLFSETGAAASVCYAQNNGASIAIGEAGHMKETIKEGGKTRTVPYLRGVGIQVSAQDDQSTAAGGVTGFRAIASSNAVAFIGPCSSVPALAIAPLIDDGKVPQVIAEAGQTTLTGPEYAFRAGIPQPYFAGRVIQVLKAKGIKSVYMIDDVSNPTLVEIHSSVKKTLQVLGMQVVGSFDATARTVDWTPAIQQIQQLHPDAVGLYLGAGQILTSAVAVRNSGYTGQLFSDQSMYSDAFLKLGAVARGAIFNTVYTDLFKYPVSERFAKEWEAKYPGTVVEPIGATGYDSMWRVLRAIHDAGPQKLANMSAADARALLQKTLAAQKGAQTAEGPVKYLPNGDVAGPGAIVMATDGNGGVQLVKVPTVKELIRK